MNLQEEPGNTENNASCRIADAANTYNWALTIIKSKGYKIFLYPDSREEYYGDFWAIKGKREFIGSDPLRLLGIIALWETLGDNWQTQHMLKSEDLYGEINKNAFPDSISEIENLTDTQFAELVSDYRIFFNSIHQIDKLPLDITRQKFFDLVSNYYKEDGCEE
jgi:hypothetical protein